MKILLTEIWWPDKRDVTNLPTEAAFDLDPRENLTEDDFVEACEDELESRHNVRPRGFRWQIFHDTIQ